MREDYKAIFLIWVLFVLNIIDATSTNILLAIYPDVRELNPFYAKEQMIFKLFILPLMLVFLYFSAQKVLKGKYLQKFNKFFTIIVSLLVVIYICVVANNLAIWVLHEY